MKTYQPDVEEWKPIKGYEGLYEVSNFGRVKSLDRINCCGKRVQSKLFSTQAKKNYITVVLNNDGNSKTFRIHRLVAQAFIPNPENKPCVNHKDGNKQNNHVNNLEWCTHSENMKHAHDTGLLPPTRKLSDDEIFEIVQNKDGLTLKRLAEKYDITINWVYKIRKVGGRP